MHFRGTWSWLSVFLALWLTGCMAAGPKRARLYEGIPREESQVALLETDPESSVYIAAINETSIAEPRLPGDFGRGFLYELPEGRHTLTIYFYTRFVSGGPMELEFEAKSGRTYRLFSHVEKENGHLIWKAWVGEQPPVPNVRN